MIKSNNRGRVESVENLKWMIMALIYAICASHDCASRALYELNRVSKSAKMSLERLLAVGFLLIDDNNHYVKSQSGVRCFVRSRKFLFGGGPFLRCWP